jgi:hypothetical protein
MEEFSLFEGDPLNRLLSTIGLRSRGLGRLTCRFLLLLLVTFVPTALFALYEGFGPSQPRTLNFFGDLGAFGQAFIGYPLFIFAEWHIGQKTRSAAHHFLHSGVVLEAGLGPLHELHAKIAKLRKMILPDIVCLVLAFIFALMWLYGETHNSYDTWHAIGAPAVQKPTLAGWWVALVGIPIFNYWWLRWIWKINLWCWYLFKVSRLRLRLIASHPDSTGGLGFLSEAQSSFAVIIFAFGIGCIAPLVGYKLQIEHADLFSFAVGGPLLGFVLGAPIFFTSPLLMFTKQLFRTKKRAMEAFQDRATEASLYFEEKWLQTCHGGNCEALVSDNLSGMRNLHAVFVHLEKMRVVPFDLRSFSQLMGSTLGSLLPLVTHIFDLPDPAKQFLEIIKPLLGSGG